MHSGIRGATEVLQQEVGQAGRITLPSTVTVTADAIVGSTALTVSSTSGMFAGEKLTLGGGATQETVVVSADPTTTTSVSVSATTIAHTAPASLNVQGGFFAGIVPSATTNGSTSSVLKMFGDINGDGNMVYIEYSISPSCICSGTCTPSTTTGNLYRNSMAWNAAAPKISATASQILLGNVTANPNGSACFNYQTATAGGNTYVTDVAVTLTVQTQQIDPLTHKAQTETKALLNVSPRNVFNTWELAGFGFTDRVQPTPASVTLLFAGAP